MPEPLHIAHYSDSNMLASTLSPVLRDFITFAVTSSVLLYAVFSLFRVGRRSHGLPPGSLYLILASRILG